ncbi:MAG: cobyric acid synthase [Lachnospiraceae bacterium]|nr:cobyric acid synthase [Lachnospiraceae bacterium]
MNDSILKTENLIIGYDKDIVGNIDLTVTAGKILTLIGPNGSGKSTLLRTLAGLHKERNGIIYLNGKSIISLKAEEIAREISVVMTMTVKPELMSCREVIATGRYPYTGMFGRLRDEDNSIIDETISNMGMEDISENPFMSISDGQKQRVMLARAICQEPSVLILDEPTSYLDIKYKLDILTRLKELVREKNIAVILSIHELDIAMHISDHVIALGEGKILKEGTVREVFRESFIRSLYGIENSSLEFIGSVPWFTDENNTEDVNNIFKAFVSPKTDQPDKEEGKGSCPVLMIQGTMSNAGKSLIAAGLCRIFANDGYRVAPFKAQNMALNSYITKAGGEMGRAQAVQAECAKRTPDVSMNPILLKPNDDHTSQVIVNGKAIGNMTAAEYFGYRKQLIPVVREAFDRLAQSSDIIIVEGAGSPVELNLNKDDIVNMGLARLIDASVILVGDIDRGGIFAQLIGTLELLEEEDRRRVKGLIVNKFRGDLKLFDEGVQILEERSASKVLGVVPYLKLNIDDEDSLSEKICRKEEGEFNIAVIRLPHISNFTDFDVFAQLPEVTVRYVDSPSELCKPDMLIIPGSKNTISDLKWLKTSGLYDRIKSLSYEGTVIFGICGGYQMLGRRIEENADGEVNAEEGLLLLPVDTVIHKDKVTREYRGSIAGATGILSSIKGIEIKGYEIHMGQTDTYEPLTEFTSGKSGYCRENIYGTYIHGFFDSKEVLIRIVRLLAEAAGKKVNTDTVRDRAVYKEDQYSILEEALRNSLDMELIYKIAGLSKP